MTEAQALALASELAKPFEALRLQPYHDPVGFPTIGWGHLLSRNAWAPLDQWFKITPEDADEILWRDMQRGLSAVVKLTSVPLALEQTAALIDFCFNCGGGNYQASTLRQRVNDEDWEGAAGQFGRWVYAGAVRLPGLVRRRAAERDLFLSAS